MKKQENNYAFIDSNNLNLAIKDCGWNLDFTRFRIYLKEKYNVTKAYLFIGFIEKNYSLYKSLQEKGYILIFKPTFQNSNVGVKGNCDAELVLQAMIDYNKYSKAVIISGDGDFYCLIRYLVEQNKLKKVLIPNQKSYSSLLKKFPSEFLAFVSDLRQKLEYIKEKNPVRTKP